MGVVWQFRVTLRVPLWFWVDKSENKRVTNFQRVFIQNLRFLRNQKGLSQAKLSELIDVTPNYLNAIENGKNFPSPEVLQRIIDILEIMPYQLFLEYPGTMKIGKQDEKILLIQELNYLKQQFINEFDKTIRKYENS